MSNSLDPDQTRHFFFQKILSGIPSERQTVWIQIRPDIFFKKNLSGIPSECQTVWIIFFKRILSGIPSECQTVWIQIRVKNFFFNNSFRNTRVSNRLDPDQAPHFFSKESFQEYHQSVKQFGSRSSLTFFFKEFFQEYHQSISSDPDQDQHFFKRILSGIQSECLTVWIQIRPDIFLKIILSGIIISVKQFGSRSGPTFCRA